VVPLNESVYLVSIGGKLRGKREPEARGNQIIVFAKGSQSSRASHKSGGRWKRSRENLPQNLACGPWKFLALRGFLHAKQMPPMAREGGGEGESIAPVRQKKKHDRPAAHRVRKQTRKGGQTGGFKERKTGS